MNDNSGMDESQSPPPQTPPQPASPQRRLQELRAIPERDRKDAEWDELNELEIMLASAMRTGNPDPNIRREGGAPRGQQQQRRPGGGQPGGQPGNQNRNRQNRGRPRQR